MYKIIQVIFDTNKQRAIAEQVISTKFDKWSDAVFKACFYRDQCASVYTMAGRKDYIYMKRLTT